jgi:pimeloyl-ACP methyl ester carboxylesterase
MSHAEMNAEITLPDGRTLSYMQAGADIGPVVTVLDGPCSRGLGRALAPTARELGIRLLIPDRPGIHGSTAQPGRTIADWPADQLALLDALGIDRTGVVTQSGGTGYGVAVAASAPHRLTGLALLGGLAPMNSRKARKDAGKQLRTAVLLARKAPFVLKAGLKQSYKKLPGSAIAQVPAADRPFLEDPFIRDIHLNTMREFLGTPDAAIEEIRLLTRPCVGHHPTTRGSGTGRTVDREAGRNPPAPSRPPRRRPAGRRSTGHRRPGCQHLRSAPRLP